MKNTLADLFTSKRFFVTLLATGAAVYLCATGKISADQLNGTVAHLAMILTIAYGVEEAAAAHGVSFPTPDPGPTATATVAQVVSDGKVTPAETPIAKAEAAAKGAV